MSELKRWNVVYKDAVNRLPEDVGAGRIWFENDWVIFGDEDGDRPIFRLALNSDEISSITGMDES